MLSVCSVRKLFNKTVATLFDFHYPRNQQVAKWVINAKVLQVEKRQYPSTGHSGDTYVTFFDNTIGPVKGLIHAAAKLAELADRGRLPQLRAHIALLCFALPCLALQGVMVFSWLAAEAAQEPSFQWTAAQKQLPLYSVLNQVHPTLGDAMPGEVCLWATLLSFSQHPQVSVSVNNG